MILADAAKFLPVATVCFSPLCVILLSLNLLHLFDFIVIVLQLFQSNTAFSCVFKISGDIFTSSPTIGIFCDMLSKISPILSSQCNALVKSWHHRAKECECERNGWTTSVKSDTECWRRSQTTSCEASSSSIRREGGLVASKQRLEEAWCKNIDKKDCPTFHPPDIQAYIGSLGRPHQDNISSRHWVDSDKVIQNFSWLLTTSKTRHIVPFLNGKFLT